MSRFPLIVGTREGVRVCRGALGWGGGVDTHGINGGQDAHSNRLVEEDTANFKYYKEDTAPVWPSLVCTAVDYFHNEVRANNQ